MIHALFILLACSSSLVSVVAAIIAGDEDGVRIGVTATICSACAFGLLVSLAEHFSGRKATEATE